MALSFPPNTNDLDVCGLQDQNLQLHLSGTDDHGIVRFRIVLEEPAHGRLVNSAGVTLHVGNTVPATSNGADIIYIPNPGYSGLDEFKYAAIDNDSPGQQDLTPATVHIEIVPPPVADVGVAIEAGYDNLAGASASGNVLTNDNHDGGAGLSVIKFTFNGTTVNAGQSVNGLYGVLTVNANGSYTYVVNNAAAAVDQLRTSGNTLTETFTYVNLDDHADHDCEQTSTLTITIQGHDDAPTPTPDAAAAIEAGCDEPGTTATGNVLANDTDVDAGDTKSVTQVKFGANTAAAGSALAGAYGSLTVNADGSYVYTVNNGNSTVDALQQGQSLTEVFNYTVTDAAGATATTTLTITINGTNDDPVAHADNGDANEAGVVAGTTATGNVLANDTDVDAGDTHAVSQVKFGATSVAAGATLAGAYGSLVLNADGSYTYTVDNANPTVNALRLPTDTLTETFSYTVTDAHGCSDSTTLTIVIHGANDAPTPTPDVGAAIESGCDQPGTTAAGNVLANDTGVDAGDTKAITQVKFGATTAAAGASINGAYGSLVVNADGSYVYTVNNGNSTVDALQQGQSLTEVFNTTVTDAGGASATTTLTITINGTNDDPIANNDTGDANEAGVVAGTTATGNVLTNDTDVDTGDTKMVSQVKFGATTASAGATLAGAYGSLVLNANGTYTYTVDNANPTVNALRLPSQTLTETFTYTVTDSKGCYDTATLTITLHGANDGPVANPNVGTAVEEGCDVAGSAATGNLLANDTDVDSGDTKTVVSASKGAATAAAGGTLTGAYGSLVVNADGSYVYTVANGNPTVDALKNGQSLTEVFNYTMKDAAGATSTSTLTITVQGSNDDPDAINDSAGIVQQGQSLTISRSQLLSNDTDPEHDTLSLVSVQGALHGTVSYNATTGIVTFTPTAGYVGAASFTYTIRDPSGCTDTATVNLQVLPAGPGVGTPGFWGNNGLVYWDGAVDPAGTKHSPDYPNFPTAELTYSVDSNANGSKDGTGYLLIGDFNKNGITDNGEHTLAISLADARALVQNGATDDPLVKIGRDLVCTWLNYLAGNPVGSPTVANTPAWFVEEAVDFLSQLAGTVKTLSGGVATYNFMSGGNFLNLDPVATITSAFQGGINLDGVAGIVATGKDVLAGVTIHTTLDGYNNDGMIGSTLWAADRDMVG